MAEKSHSDFKGTGFTKSASEVATECDERSECKRVFTAEGLVSAGNGGAIAAAIVSEYAASAHSAPSESNIMGVGGQTLGKTFVDESPISYIQRP